MPTRCILRQRRGARKWSALLLWLTLLLAAGCVPAPVTQYDQPLFCSNWTSDMTTARYRIHCAGDRVMILAWDDQDCEVFEVTDISVENGSLRATFRMPSQNHVTYSLLTPQGRDLLRETFTGSASGVILWRRARPEETRD